MDFFNTNPETRVLTENDYITAAQVLQCEVAVVKAVVAVEAGGTGFLPDGRPKILYEAHYFGKLTNYQYNTSYPNISAARWDRSLYGAAGEHQYERLSIAMSLDRAAALRSASWGFFQIMGDNFLSCGYTSVEEFVLANIRSAKEQLLMFCEFIKVNNLADELQDKRWADFARVYNGPGYAQNQYDRKMNAEYTRLVSNFTNKINVNPGYIDNERRLVMQAQSILNANGYVSPPLDVDGYIGPITKQALQLFQSVYNIPQTGELDRATKDIMGL